MKKILSVILLAVMLTAVFTSCGDAPDNTTTQGGENQGNSNQNSTNSSSSIPDKMPTTKIDIENYDSAITSNGFEIKGKKISYTKGNKNALVLNVKNTTDKNYSITLTVNYFASDGVEVIKTEKQSFTGFASGYDRYFLFQPNISYNSYTCSLEATEYSGECLEQHINVEKCTIEHDKRAWIGNTTDGDTVWGEEIGMEYRMTNSYSETLYFAATFIYFDNQGRLYSIDDRLRQNNISANQTTSTGGDKRTVLDPEGEAIQANKNRLVWPDELKDNVTVIVIFKAVSTDWLV